jgi:hypothetical protein
MTPDLACVRLCVRKGSKYGLWFADHVYTLEPQSEAARFAAERVHVVGALSGDVIRITSIKRIPVGRGADGQDSSGKAASLHRSDSSLGGSLP